MACGFFFARGPQTTKPMIIVLKPEISKREETAVLKEIRKLGYKPHVMRGVERTVIGAIGDERTHSSLETLVAWPQVEKVMPVQKRYKLVSREAHKSNSRIRLGNDVVIGGEEIIVMAGPCSVESENNFSPPQRRSKKRAHKSSGAEHSNLAPPLTNSKVSARKV